MAPDSVVGEGGLTGHLSLVMIMRACPGDGNICEILIGHPHCFRSSHIRVMEQNKPIKRNFPLNVLFKCNHRKDQTKQLVKPH